MRDWILGFYFSLRGNISFSIGQLCGRGKMGRAAASDDKDPRFKSHHHRNPSVETVYCEERDDKDLVFHQVGKF